MEKILTIAIPSYNTEQYIDKNVPTMLSSEILDRLEILIIDDGSSDNTALTAGKYHDLYPDTVKVVSKENGGHGSVINEGIRIASGRYFKVIDGDDWVEEGSLVRMIEDLEGIDADMVIHPYYFVYEGTGNRSLERFEAPAYGEPLAFDQVCHLYQKIPIHSLTYRTELLREKEIRVREHCFYEDNEYDLFPVPFVETVAVYDYPVYMYLIARKNQSVSDANVLKNHRMFYRVVRDCIDCLEKNRESLSPEKTSYMMATVLELVRSQYNIYLRSGFSRESYGKFRSFNSHFKAVCPEYFRAAGERYPYLKVLQTGSFTAFRALSLMIRVYKKVTMR